MITRRKFLKVLVTLGFGIIFSACASGIEYSPTPIEKLATATFGVTDTRTQIPTTEPAEILEETQELQSLIYF